MVEMTQGKHSVSGAGNWGVWRDDTGAFWHGKKLAVSLTGIRPVNGTLHVRFRDPNGHARKGKGTFEGRPFVIPRHQEAKDGIYWAKLSVMAEDKPIFSESFEGMSGHNLPEGWTFLGKRGEDFCSYDFPILYAAFCTVLLHLCW